VVIRILIVSLIVGLGGLYARALSSQRVGVTAMPNFDLMPTTIAGWYSQDFPLSESIAAVLDADLVLQRGYRNASGNEVWLFLAYFAEQQVNSQIHSPRHCVPGSGWNVSSLESQTVQLAQGPENVACMSLERLGTEQEMLYWFRTRSGTVTGEYALKWDLVRNALARRPTDALFVRYHARKQDAEAMQQLMRQLDPAMNNMLREVGLE
jgi:EpsI family protein